MASMNTEEQTQSLLGPSREELAGVKVFPLITQLKKDVIVRLLYGLLAPINSYNDIYRITWTQR